jgi:activator of 2-hydroxyglutaryl-CoA dehydratase
MIRTNCLMQPLMFSEGVVQNQAIARMLEEETVEEVIVPRHTNCVWRGTDRT